MSVNTLANAVEAVINADSAEGADKALETLEATLAGNDKPAADATPDKPKGKKGKGKASAKKGKKGKGKSDDKPARTPTERDAFGNRKGTSAGAINATILAAKGPLSCREIHERTGANGRATMGATYRHLSWLLERGHVKLKDGAFVKNVKAKKPKAVVNESEGADDNGPGDDKPAAE